MAASPDNPLIAAQALNHAVTAGDWPLAISSARILDRAGRLLPDGRFLLLADAVKRRDWRGAGAVVDAIAQDEVFAFAVPVLRAWLAFGAGARNPAAILDGPGDGGAGAAYAAEHEVLIRIAQGRPEGVSGLRELLASVPGRANRLRIAAAAQLAKKGDRETALALLEGNDPPVAAARAAIAEGRAVPGAIATAEAGIAELVVRLALDLNAQELRPLAMGFSRLATYLAPESGEAWLIAAELYGLEDRHKPALDMLARIPAGDPYAGMAEETRIRLLADSGRTDDALAQAYAAAQAPDAGVAQWVRLGEVFSQLNRHAEAADAYGRAIAARSEESNITEWGLWLLRGGALHQAGNWPEAKAALSEAHRLAPREPLVLNYLGYSMLEQRENLEEAEAMIREAHRLAPDSAAITDSLGWALHLRGRTDEALPLLEQAARGEPADTEINEHLGDAYYAAGRRIEARFAWQAALVYADEDDAARLRAKIETGLTPQLAAR